VGQWRALKEKENQRKGEEEKKRFFFPKNLETAGKS